MKTLDYWLKNNLERVYLLEIYWPDRRFMAWQNKLTKNISERKEILQQ